MAVTDDNRELYAATKNEELAAELETRGLVKTGNKDEMVERLLAHDIEVAAAAQDKAAEDPPAAPICVECWPGGWPHAHDTASCAHGEWTNTNQ